MTIIINSLTINENEISIGYENNEPSLINTYFDGTSSVGSFISGTNIGWFEKTILGDQIDNIFNSKNNNHYISLYNLSYIYGNYPSPFGEIATESNIKASGNASLFPYPAGWVNTAQNNAAAENGWLAYEIYSNTYKKLRSKYSNVNFGITISGQSSYIYLTNKQFWDKITDQNQYNYFNTFMKKSEFKHINFDIETGYTIDFIDGLIKWCKGISSYSKNNINSYINKTKIIIILGGNSLLGGKIGMTSGVNSLDTLYNNNRDYYNKLETLVDDINNNNKYIGIKGLKIQYYCYGKFQITKKLLIYGEDTINNTKYYANPITLLSKSKIFYKNFNIVFYLTPNGTGNNDGVFTNKEVVNNINNILQSNDEPINYIKQNDFPIYIWTDTNAYIIPNECGNCITKWINTKSNDNTNIYQILNNYQT